MQAPASWSTARATTAASSPPRTSQPASGGIHAFGEADDFDLLVIPPFAPDVDVSPATWAEAARVCEERRAIVLVDAPASWAPDAIEAELATWELPRANAALYYPRLLAADPLDGGRVASFAPSGAVAGVIARTDTERALWKAPAGTRRDDPGCGRGSRARCRTPRTRV